MLLARIIIKSRLAGYLGLAILTLAILDLHSEKRNLEKNII